MGALRDAIVAVLSNGALTEAEKRIQIAQIKAVAHLDQLQSRLPYTRELGPYTVTVSGARYDTTGNYLELMLSAVVTATGVRVPLDNHYRYVNPPVSVDDPTGDIILTATDPVLGQITVRRMREAPLLALAAMVLDSINYSVAHP